MEVLGYKISTSFLDEDKVNKARKYGCISPVRIDDSFYGCGRCPLCQAKRRRDWSFRLGVEMQHATTAFFITLTYSDVNLPRIRGRPTLHKPDLQKYIKRLRNNQRKIFIEDYKTIYPKSKNLNSKLFQKLINKRMKREKPVKYYAVGEYGSQTDRPHYHALIFNLDKRLTDDLGKIWDLGHVKVGTVSPMSINYTTKYMLKDFGKNDWREKPFSVMSRRPAIGYQYLEDMGCYHLENESMTVRNINGNFQFMPRYFREKLFLNDEDRRQIVSKHMQEYNENRQKEIERLKSKGQLTEDLEISKVVDIIRRKEIQKKDNKF